MRHYELIRAMGLLTILVSCGGDSGGSKSGDGDGGKSNQTADEALCGRICARSTAAKCKNDEPDCIDECVNQIASTPSACKKTERAFTACAEKAKFTCDGDAQAEAKDCAKELLAYATCLDAETSDDHQTDDDDGSSADQDAGATRDSGTTSSRDSGTTTANRCAPASNDDACDTCLKEGCCSEVTKCGADCVAVVDCATECGPDERCITACLEKYPGGVEAFVALTSCTQQECGTACAGSSE